MTKLVVETPEGVEIRIELAGAGSRAAAALVDLVLFGFVATATFLILALTARWLTGGLDQFVIGLFLGGSTLLGLAYPFAWHVAADGQTPGKKLLRIRVVAADGSPASTAAHLLRSLILLVDLLPVPAPIGLLLTAVTPRHTRLGDLAAGTLVVRIGESAQVAEPWRGERWSQLPTRILALDPLAAARLDRRDVEYLRDVAARRDLLPTARAELQTRVVATYAQKLGADAPLPGGDPAAGLRELFLFAREHTAETQA